MAKKSKPKIWLEYAAARAALGFLGNVPRKSSLRLGKSAAKMALFALKSLRRTGMRNLEIAFPEKSIAEREKLLKGTFENLGRVLGEMSQFPQATPEKLGQLMQFQIDHLIAEYGKLKAEGRGVIIVSAHLGNWELFVYAWSAFYGPMSYLARPLDNPLIENLTASLRTKFGNRPINKSNSINLALKVLREAGILGILADVNVHPKEGVFVPFFGVPACTSTGAALLALRSKAVIIPMCGVWDEKKQHYIAVHGEIIEPSRTGDRHRDVLETTARFTAEIEKLIRAYPDQWLWIHKRWKTRPPGGKNLYD
ncbi:MAG: lysophospholipid acyltransferase family protein [Acidobacteriota bacterium]|nr:lysophospholipid acyltransferase family protein [Acidobacteriota bacterium]